MGRKMIAALLCLGIVSCSRSPRSSFTPDEVRITADGITDTHVVLSFSVDPSEEMTCPGVNVVRHNKRLDVEFVRIRQGGQTPKTDVAASVDTSTPGQFTVKIPYKIAEQDEVEVFIGGKKSLGKWSRQQEQPSEDALRPE